MMFPKILILVVSGASFMSTASATVTVIQQRRLTQVNTQINAPPTYRDEDILETFGHFDGYGNLSQTSGGTFLSGTVSLTSDFSVTGDSIYLSLAGSNSFTYQRGGSDAADLRAGDYVDFRLTVDTPIPYTFTLSSTVSGSGYWEFGLQKNGDGFVFAGSNQSLTYDGVFLPGNTYTYYSHLQGPLGSDNQSGNGSYNLTLQSTPEPSSSILLLSSAGLLCLLRTRAGSGDKAQSSR